MEWIMRARTMDDSLSPASGRNDEAQESTDAWPAVNRALMVLAELLLSGCMSSGTGDGDDTLAVREAEFGGWCGDTVAGATWLDDATGDGQVLRVSMGQKATGGYGLRLADDEVRRQSDGWRLTLHWDEPDRRSIVAQVVTMPCLEVVFPRRPEEPVRVVDTDGRQRMVVR